MPAAGGACTCSGALRCVRTQPCAQPQLCPPHCLNTRKQKRGTARKQRSCQVHWLGICLKRHCRLPRNAPQQAARPQPVTMVQQGSSQHTLLGGAPHDGGRDLLNLHQLLRRHRRSERPADAPSRRERGRLPGPTAPQSPRGRGERVGCCSFPAAALRGARHHPRLLGQPSVVPGEEGVRMGRGREYNRKTCKH